MIKEQIVAKKRAAKEEALATKRAAKEEKLRLKEERRLAREERKREREERKQAKAQRRINNSDGSEEDQDDEEEDEETEDDFTEEESEEEDEEEEEEEDSEINVDDIDLEDIDLSEYGVEMSDLDYGSEEASATSTDSDPVSSDDYGAEAEDREYTGDMFGEKKPIRFAAAKFEMQGQENHELETNDYCCIAIWHTGGKHMRYTRLKDTTLRVPPLSNDQRFRVGHDAKRLFYVGNLEGKKVLVVIYLKDLSHEFIELPDQEVQTFEDASLFQHYLCYYKERKIDAGKVSNKKFHRFTKDFYVLDFKSGEIVWHLPDCEKVFFAGKNAADCGMMAFVDRTKKLREKGDEEAEMSEESDALSLHDEADEDVSDCDSDDEKHYEDFMGKIHKGIMVVKSSQEEVKVEAPKDKDDKDEKPAEGEETKGAEGEQD